MTLLHKSLFLAASIVFNVVLLFFVFSKPAMAATDWQCTDTFYDNSFCDNSLSASDYCYFSDITDLTCTVFPGITTVCSFCSFGCSAGACNIQTPTSTPTPVPLPVNCAQAGCGNFAPGGNCFCDAGCVGSNDCCSDACAVCGECPVPPTATPIPFPPFLHVSTTSINFGPIAINTSATQSFTVTNSGGGTLSGNVSLTAGDPIFSMPSGSFSLTAGQSTSFTVTFNPTAATTYTGNVSVVAGAAAANISLSGDGTSGTFCNDTDISNSTTIPGNCSDASGSKPDVCLSSTAVQQFECSGNSCVSVGGSSCPVGFTCSGGACAPAATPTLAPGQLATPTLLLPDNLATGVSTTPTFTWGSVPLAKAYWVTVNDTTAGTLVVSSSTLINAYTPPVPLVANHAHSWNVQACVNANCAVNSNDSLVSATWTFTTAGAVSTPTPVPPTTTPTPTAGPTPTPTPIAPQACFTIDKVEGTDVTFSDCSKAGSNPPITRWVWELNGDGNSDKEFNPPTTSPYTFKFPYSDFGLVGTHTYTATLTIYDSASVGSAVSHDVTVTGSLPPLCTKSETVTVAGKQDTACTEVSTAIGPISVKGASFVTRIMSLLLGIAGGIAVLLIILAGYTLMTSRDNPEAIQEGRQKLLGAIVGLLFIALALVVLQVIGVNVLQIPGFEP